MSNTLPALPLLVEEMASANSEDAYGKVFALLFAPLLKFCYGIVKSEMAAEEIASDVLLMLWQRRQTLTAVNNVKHYAFISARNMALNYVKKQSGKTVVSLNDIDVDIQLGTVASPEAILIQGEMKAGLERAIAKLPNQAKLVFKLVKEEGFSYKETADILGISPKTVDAHLVNAVRKLVHILKQEFNLT
ncbi:RNA polymerase sigma factor [Parapedobacter lycopersici]|uniref:RNA polymerase sigma factor n=1 Tax=Parapedobacter lycopersici TaxID=1864939 RepID=UPI00214DD1D7|nr:sigma-70 family RNA polymerase sigma factor [Parapedobacter lycopersici]